MSFVDHYVGQVIRALENSPHADNTVVILVSDHGYRLGEKGTFAKNCLWQEAIRVPMVLSGSGIVSGEVVDDPVELLDLYPTIIDLAGLPHNPMNEGKSLLPVLQGGALVEKRHAIATYGRNNHAVITRDYWYIRYEDGSEELYDRHSDPNAFTNIAGDPALEDEKVGLKALLPQENRLWAPASATSWPDYLVRQRKEQMSGL